ncbi:fts3-like protein [Cichlidogyrus casuarinus]|uniref:Ferritin n=1 Tax=Cichlidogyrus casuarinus TaxID=1844966 RepID=A0ABD2Q3M8_9PLAT
MTLVRQNFSQPCEAAINKQINMELFAHYTYLSMAYHFDRDDIALEGFHKFFLEQSAEERKHAMMLMKYQNDRGGRIVWGDVKQPAKSDWGTGLDAMTEALNLEKEVNESLLALHSIAAEQNDAHLQDFLEANYLSEQVESIRQISGYIANLKRVGPGLGEYQFDKITLQEEHKQS